MTYQTVGNQKRIVRSFLTFVLALLVFLSPCPGGGREVRGDAPSEEEGEETEERSEEEILEDLEKYREGIVHVESICGDGEDKVYRRKSFSGFVVSQNSSGIYVVTVQKNLAFSAKEKETIQNKYKLENNARLEEKIEVVFNGDLRIEADTVGESPQRNLTVLKLNQTVHFENVLRFSQENASDKEKIYLFSFPKAPKAGGVYNEEGVEILPGTVLSSWQEEEVGFLEHDISAGSISRGGPLLNEEGAVEGMLLTGKGDKAGTAISSASIREFLETLNVSFEEYEIVEEEKKLPVLNIVLGVVIGILLVAVIVRLVKNRSEQEHDRKEVPGKEPKKKKNASVGPVKNAQAFLEYPSGGLKSRVDKTIFVIGRDPEADFPLEGKKEISRNHASIEYDGKYFYIRDLNSRNHTVLNGYQLMPEERKRLKDGDQILLGKEELVFRMNEGRL